MDFTVARSEDDDRFAVAHEESLAGDGGRWNATRAIPMIREGDAVEIRGESVRGRLYGMKSVPVADPHHVFRRP